MNWITEIISPVFMEALGWTLLHSLWQGLVIMSVLGLALAFIDSKNSQLRYLLSVSAACVMLVWTSFTLVDEYQYAAAKVSETVSQPTFYAWDNIQIEIQEELSVQEKVVSLFESIPAIMKPLIPWITFGWILGVIIFTVRWLGGIVYLRHLRTNNIMPVAYLWQLKANKLARKMGIGKTILLRESSAITVPMVIGHLKPVILIPVGILNGLTPQQLEAIFVHELAHIQRYDFVINLVLSQIEALFFYHPAFWWISAKIRDEREHCCDDIAVSMCKDPVSYARTLADLEAQKHQSVHLSMGLAGRKNHLLTRIQRIVMPDLNHSQSGPKIFFAALLVILMTSTAWVSPSAEPAEWPENPNEAPKVQQIFPGMVYQIEPQEEAAVSIIPASVETPKVKVEIPQIFSIEIPEWNVTFVDSPPPASMRFYFPENLDTPEYPEPIYYQGKYNGVYFKDTIFFPGQFDGTPFEDFLIDNQYYKDLFSEGAFQNYLDTHQDQWLEISESFDSEAFSQQYQEALAAYERAIKLMAESNSQEFQAKKEKIKIQQRSLMELERRLNNLRNHELQEREMELNRRLQREERLAEREAREAELQRERQLLEKRLFLEQAEDRAREKERQMRALEREMQKLKEVEKLAELEELYELKELKELEKLEELKELAELKRLKELEKLEGIAKLKELKGLAALGELSELSFIDDEIHTFEDRMKGFKTTFAASLRVDGYIRSNTKKLDVKINRNSMKVNGKEITGNDFDRYMNLMESFGFELSRGSQLTMDLD